ncbi:hypothetical protein FSP39_024411 [Pinctada imbricata]|uniref:Uncharacterized protein n=1 Tax=Pinctada imbricata TaxID=66713 RepID=A0AA89C111_PINIB|nr:hypothetical protein FSP39_024411 [Pinctada imbricata]
MVKTWTDLLRRLTAKGKIEEALVLNSAGDIITCSPGLRLSETDINGIRCIFGSHYYSLMKLNFCGRSYTCFRNCESHNCMIGRCEDRILVMQHYNDMVILGMSTSGGYLPHPPIYGVVPCPDEDVFACLVNPCEVSSCAKVPKAVCKADFCKGCNARYFVGKKEVTSLCCNLNDIPKALCPPGVPIFNCLVDPCSIATCPKYPTANCRDDFCGGCNARWFIGDTEVTKKCDKGIQNQDKTGSKANKQKPPPYEKKRTPDMGVRSGAQDE